MTFAAPRRARTVSPSPGRARRIARSSGGDVVLEPAEGSTRFAVRLPQERLQVGAGQLEALGLGEPGNGLALRFQSRYQLPLVRQLEHEDEHLFVNLKRQPFALHAVEGRSQRLVRPAGERKRLQLDAGLFFLAFQRDPHRQFATLQAYDAEAFAPDQKDHPWKKIKALILTGTGDKAFASGTDISQFRAFKTAQDALDYEARIDRVHHEVDAVGARRLGHLVQSQIVTARDVDQHPLGALDRGLFEERRGDRPLRRFERPVLVLTAQDAVDAKVATLRAGAPYWVMHRADLQAALQAQVNDHPDIDLRRRQRKALIGAPRRHPERLGLAIAQSITEAHGGTVEAANGSAGAQIVLRLERHRP